MGILRGSAMFLNAVQIAMFMLSGHYYLRGDAESAIYILLTAIFNEMWFKRIKEGQ